MNKILFLISLFLSLCTNVYAASQNNHQHYDKANIKNRSYGLNFKDFALLNCLQIADKKLNKPVNKDLKGATGSFIQEWVAFDADDTEKTKMTMSEINRLSEKYINEVGRLKRDPNATVYTLGCLNFYHSDDLNNLMRSFVTHPELTFREEYTD